MRIVSLLLLGVSLGVWGQAEDRPRAQAYTNEDLERMRPLRGETGVESTPAVDPAAMIRQDTDTRKSGSGEAYWRREAARVRGRAQALRESASTLRLRIEQQRASFTGPRQPKNARQQKADQIAQVQLRQRQLEARARQMEDELEDRARRAGALPGWLREAFGAPTIPR